MKAYLTKHLELCQFQVISISETWSILPSVQVQLCFPILVLYFLIFFFRIPYPGCRHIAIFFFSPYLFPELFYTVLRWCFFYHSLVFSPISLFPCVLIFPISLFLLLLLLLLLIIIIIIIIIVIVIVIIMFNVIFNRAEILVSLVFAARADITRSQRSHSNILSWVLNKRVLFLLF